jgi:hypothetical protein
LDFERSRGIHKEIRVTFLDPGFSEAFMDELPTPRTMKTHHLPEHLPEDFNHKAKARIHSFICVVFSGNNFSKEKHSNFKIVYVMRNPKDMIVSYFNFTKNLKLAEYTGTLAELVDTHTNEDKIAYGGWCRHVNAFYNIPGIHIIRYEELIAV